MVSKTLKSGFIFGAILLSMTYSNNTLGIDFIQDSNNSSSQIKIKLGKKNTSEDLVQSTMKFYDVGTSDKGKREDFIGVNVVKKIGDIDIDTKNVALTLEGNQWKGGIGIDKLNIGILNHFLLCFSPFMSGVAHKDKKDIQDIIYNHNVSEHLPCVELFFRHNDFYIRLNFHDFRINNFVLEPTILSSFLSFGEKWKVSCIKSLGMHCDSIKNAKQNNTDKVLVKFAHVWNMGFLNIINLVADFPIGTLYADLNTFNTSFREYQQHQMDGTNCANATHFSLYGKFSNKGENWINYNFELSGIMGINCSGNFSKCFILARTQKDYEDFTKQVTSKDNFEGLPFNNNEPYKGYFNGTLSLKRFGFLHNNVACVITADFSFSLNGQGYIKQGTFSTFGIKYTDQLYTMYGALIVKLELIKGGVIVVDLIPFVYDNCRGNDYDKIFSKLSISLNLNKLYNLLFGKENVKK